MAHVCSVQMMQITTTIITTMVWIAKNVTTNVSPVSPQVADVLNVPQTTFCSLRASVRAQMAHMILISHVQSLTRIAPAAITMVERMSASSAVRIVLSAMT